jgi:hypothetical protein
LMSCMPFVRMNQRIGMDGFDRRLPHISDHRCFRFVNHTLANLDVKNDVNPFAIREPNMFVKGVKPGYDSIPCLIQSI